MERFTRLFQVMVISGGAVFGLVDLNGEETPKPDSGSNRLLNGVDSSASIAPYHAYIDLRHCYPGQPADEFFPAWCGGAIISKLYILTAAHCLYRQDRNIQLVVPINNYRCVRVRVGSQWREKGGVIIKAAKLFRYKSFKFYTERKNRRDDVGIIRLSKPLEFTNEVQPVYVPTAAQFDSTWDKSPCRITGSGQTKRVLHGGLMSNSSKDFPDRRQLITSDLLKNDECNKKYKQDKKTGNDTEKQKEINQYEVKENQICTYKDGVSTCVNDSGGPVVCFSRVGTPMLTGLVSDGFGCGTKIPNFHANPGAKIFHDWIKKTTGLKLDK